MDGGRVGISKTRRPSSSSMCPTTAMVSVMPKMAGKPTNRASPSSGRTTSASSVRLAWSAMLQAMCSGYSSPPMPGKRTRAVRSPGQSARTSAICRAEMPLRP